MKKLKMMGVALAAGAFCSPAFARDLVATGEISFTRTGSDYDYTITLTNSSTSTDSAGTFWFAWVPGKDFLPTNPIAGDFISPTGWTEKVTHGGSTDGYAIQWVSASTASDLAPGNSLTFGFTSADTPAQLAADSPFYPTFPVTTAFVYQGAPFVGDSDQLVAAVASVPEPSTLVVGSVALIAGIAYAGVRRLRRVPSAV